MMRIIKPTNNQDLKKLRHILCTMWWATVGGGKLERKDIEGILFIYL